MVSRNENCLKDMACPNCGQNESFDIVAMAVFTVTDDGTDGPRNVEWDSDSPCYCTDQSCGWMGTVGDTIDSVLTT